MQDFIESKFIIQSPYQYSVIDPILYRDIANIEEINNKNAISPQEQEDQKLSLSPDFEQVNDQKGNYELDQKENEQFTDQQEKEQLDEEKQKEETTSHKKSENSFSLTNIQIQDKKIQELNNERNQNQPCRNLMINDYNMNAETNKDNNIANWHSTIDQKFEDLKIYLNKKKQQIDEELGQLQATKISKIQHKLNSNLSINTFQLSKACQGKKELSTKNQSINFVSNFPKTCSVINDFKSSKKANTTFLLNNYQFTDRLSLKSNQQKLSFSQLDWKNNFQLRPKENTFQIQNFKFTFENDNKLNDLYLQRERNKLDLINKKLSNVYQKKSDLAWRKFEFL